MPPAASPSLLAPSPHCCETSVQQGSEHSTLMSPPGPWSVGPCVPTPGRARDCHPLPAGQSESPLALRPHAPRSRGQKSLLLSGGPSFPP